MKITKKILAAVAALLVMGAFSFAQEQEEHPEVPASGAKFSFENELSSDIVYIDVERHPTDDNRLGIEDGVNFAGIAEMVNFKFDSDRVDAGVKLKFKLAPERYINGDLTAGTSIGLGWVSDDIDYWVEFRPFKILTLAYHDNVFMRGAYLPVADKELEPGNLGSDGFTVFLRPIDGLRIAVSVPFGQPWDHKEGYNMFNGDFTFGAGVDYTHKDLFSVGVAVHDIIDGGQITIGGYGLIRPTKARDLTIRLGFAHTQMDLPGIVVDKLNHRKTAVDRTATAPFTGVVGAGITGKDIYNASIEYLPGKLSLAAEIAGNIAPKDNAYDMYIGLLFGYQFTDSFAFEIRQRILLDLDASATNEDAVDTAVNLTPKFILTHKKHQFSFGVDMEFVGADFDFAFPIAWKYTL